MASAQTEPTGEPTGVSVAEGQTVKPSNPTIDVLRRVFGEQRNTRTDVGLDKHQVWGLHEPARNAHAFWCVFLDEVHIEVHNITYS